MNLFGLIKTQALPADRGLPTPSYYPPMPEVKPPKPWPRSEVQAGDTIIVSIDGNQPRSLSWENCLQADVVAPATTVANLNKGNTMNVLAILNTVISAVKSVEAVANTPNADGTITTSTGQQKLDAAITMIEAVEGSVTPMLPALQALIATIVGLFNLKGIFKKAA